jgi:coenzyme F420-0:L-glutamate ligase/coenzyme F420-1:gamma-L-glutamate ligase
LNRTPELVIKIIPLSTIGEVRPGADLTGEIAAAITTADLAPRENDVLVVTQKIVSKAEGRYVDLAQVRPGDSARAIAEQCFKDPRLVELVLQESEEVVRIAPHVLITRHRSGHVMANAGIDQSNVGPGRQGDVLLLPEDADASAARLRDELTARWGVSPAVVVSDSFGRPWRHGVTLVAIGASGLPSLVDCRGDQDRDGRTMAVTQVALADMIATAAGLATGEGAEGIPAALVRGVVWEGQPRPASALIRPKEEDLFSTHRHHDALDRRQGSGCSRRTQIGRHHQTMSWTAIIPIKEAPQRKTRLAQSLSPIEGARISHQILLHVARTVSCHHAVDQVMLVSPSIPSGWMWSWRRDEGRGLNAELQAARNDRNIWCAHHSRRFAFP